MSTVLTKTQRSLFPEDTYDAGNEKNVWLLIKISFKITNLSFTFQNTPLKSTNLNCENNFSANVVLETIGYGQRAMAIMRRP
jgi:hypothetical protein